MPVTVWLLNSYGQNKGAASIGLNRCCSLFYDLFCLTAGSLSASIRRRWSIRSIGIIRCIRCVRVVRRCITSRIICRCVTGSIRRRIIVCGRIGRVVCGGICRCVSRRFVGFFRRRSIDSIRVYITPFLWNLVGFKILRYSWAGIIGKKSCLTADGSFFHCGRHLEISICLVLMEPLHNLAP